MTNLDKLRDFCERFKIKSIKELSNDIKANCKNVFIDEEGYKYSLSLDNMKVTLRRNGVFAKFFNNNPYTEDNIKNFLQKEDKPFAISNFEGCKGARDKIKFKCKVCEKAFLISWNQVQKGVGCTECSKNKLREIAKSKRHSIEQVRKYLSSFQIMLLEEEYLGNDKKMKCFCHTHGEFYSDWINMRKANHPCAKCARLNKKVDTETPLVKLKEAINKEQYKIVGEYVNSKTKIEVFCFKCESSFFIRPDHLRNGIGCPCSSPISKGEQRIKEVLLKHNISFTTQKTFYDCIGKRKGLRFDFFLDELNILIEFQGEQHYKPVEVFGGEKGFKEQQQSDKIKKEWAKKNNIKLLEIRYDEYDKIQEIIESLI